MAWNNYKTLRVFNERVKKRNRRVQKSVLNSEEKRKERGPDNSGGKQLAGVIALAVVVIALSGFLVARFLYTSEYFVVKNVLVSGNEFLAKEEIYSSGMIESGMNIFKTDIGAMHRNIANIPRVREVVVTRQLPNTISVKLKERKPMAFVNMNVAGSSSLFGMDEEGSAFQIGKEESKLEMPIITGIKNGEVALGKKTESLDVLKALKIADFINNAKLPEVARISEINVSDPANVLLYTANSGTQVRLGAEDISKKILQLVKILEYASSNGKTLKYIDLRFNEPISMANNV